LNGEGFLKKKVFQKKICPNFMIEEESLGYFNLDFKGVGVKRVYKVKLKYTLCEKSFSTIQHKTFNQKNKHNFNLMLQENSEIVGNFETSFISFL
jgi:uncharacterized lipoprotein YehR (DUF1307 family)